MARNIKIRKGRSRATRILVDMDGVLCDFEGFFLQKYREKYPDSPYIPLEDRKTFYLSDQYKTFGPDVVAKTESITEAEGFYKNIPAIPNAVDAVEEISRLENVEVFICTSQHLGSSHCVQEKFDWIDEHFGKDWTARVIITRDKTIVAGDLLFDDKAEITGVEIAPTWDQVLFTACNNKHWDVKELQAKCRLDSWDNKEKWMQIIRDCQKKLS